MIDSVLFQGNIPDNNNYAEIENFQARILNKFILDVHMLISNDYTTTIDILA